MKIMKASELRLGNWVEQPNDGVTRVTAVLNDLQIKTETEYVDKYCRADTTNRRMAFAVWV
jgi:hypothetical protein